MLRTVLKGTAVGLLAKAVNSVGFLIVLPMMLRKLGANTFGLWMTISSLVSIAAVLDLGIGNNLMNRIATAGNDRASINKMVSLSYAISLTVVGMLLLALAVLFPHINWSRILGAGELDQDTRLAIFLTFSLFLLSLTANTIYSVQRGMQRADIANGWQLGSSIIYLLALWLVLNTHTSLAFISVVSYGIPLAGAILNSIWFFKRERIELRLFPIRWTQAREFLFSGSAFLFLQIAALIAFQVDALILAHLIDFEAVSVYSVAAKIFAIPTSIVSIYTLTLWPAYAKAFSEKNFTWIKRTFNRSILVSLVVVGAFVIFVLLFHEQILTYWLRNRITIPINVLAAFGIWCIINSAVELHLSILLNGLYRLKIQLYTSVLMIISNLVLSIYLTQVYGVAGVIWGTIISTVLFSTIPLFFYIIRFIKKEEKSLHAQ